MNPAGASSVTVRRQPVRLSICRFSPRRLLLLFLIVAVSFSSLLSLPVPCAANQICQSREDVNSCGVSLRPSSNCQSKGSNRISRSTRDEFLHFLGGDLNLFRRGIEVDPLKTKALKPRKRIVQMWKVDECNKEGKTLLERCDKLLQSIAEMAAAEASAGDSQPSLVSVLDASLYNEESSPSLVMKRSHYFGGISLYFGWDQSEMKFVKRTCLIHFKTVQECKVKRRCKEVYKT